MAGSADEGRRNGIVWIVVSMIVLVSILGTWWLVGDTNEEGASSSSTDTTAPASDETSPPTVSTTTTTTVVAPTVADLEQALKDEIEASYPQGPGVVQCDASGELADWQAIECTFVPDEPAEFGGVYVSILDGGRYAWDLGECCGAAPLPDDYPSGLLCRDLIVPPPGTAPDRYLPVYDQLSYGLAVFYWLTEDRPDRMDEDLNGRPCETIYPAPDVSAFWDSVRAL